MLNEGQPVSSRVEKTFSTGAPGDIKSYVTINAFTESSTNNAVSDKKMRQADGESESNNDENFDNKSITSEHRAHLVQEKLESLQTQIEELYQENTSLR